MTRATALVHLVVLSLAFAPSTQAQGRAKGKREPIDPAGIARLIADSGGEAQVSVHEATGAARFVRRARGKALGLLKQTERAASSDAKKDQSTRFFEAYGGVFGISDASGELQAVGVAKDRQGGTHITYRQVYRGLPVFAGQLRSHFDAADELVAVNGTFVPEILVDPNPRRTAEEAGKTALAKVEADSGQTGKLSVAGTTLLVFREGLAQGVAGPEPPGVAGGGRRRGLVREFVYIDAHTGKFIDQITGIFDGKSRRAYDAAGATAPGPNYPATPFWVEGDAFPTASAEANNMISASGETYDLFSNAFGRDSFDAAGAIMDSIFNRGNGCPNASWNGLFISFCPGTTSDDVTAHEWGHAYTQYTHNLIYQWQPGALNESYSDIWGEVVDVINGRQTDAPAGCAAPAAVRLSRRCPPQSPSTRRRRSPASRTQAPLRSAPQVFASHQRRGAGQRRRRHRRTRTAARRPFVPNAACASPARSRSSIAASAASQSRSRTPSSTGPSASSSGTTRAERRSSTWAGPIRRSRSRRCRSLRTTARPSRPSSPRPR